MHAALALLRRRPHFRRLWAGGVTSLLGDSIGWVAVAMLALQRGGGPLDLALVFLAHHLPEALLAPIAGSVADRVDRRLLLCVTSLALGGITLLMAAAAAGADLLALQVLLMVRSAAVAFIRPAERAALPRVVEDDELLLAGALDAASWSVMFGLGMAAGGAISLLGPVIALVLDAITFGLAAACFSRLPRLVPAPDEDLPPVRLMHGLRDALAFVWPRPRLRAAVFAKAGFGIAAGGGWIALAVQADALGGAAFGGLGFGLLQALRGMGSGVGPALVVGRTRLRPGVMWPSAVGIGLLSVLALAVSNHPAALGLAALGWGLGGGTNWVLSTAQIQRLAPDAIAARTNALDQFGSILGMSLGTIAVALALEGGRSPLTAVAIATTAALLPLLGLWRTAVVGAAPLSGGPRH
ncbi:MAG: MFS transporter [Myxococcota bacterium]